jgi:hypothetical protein
MRLYSDWLCFVSILQAVCETRPVIFNSLLPEDSLRQYVVEFLERQSNQSEKARKAEHVIDQQEVLKPNATELKDLMDCSPNAEKMRAGSDRDDVCNVEISVQSRDAYPEENSSCAVLTNETVEIKRPSTGTTATPRIFLPLTPQCTFPTNSAAATSMKIVGRASSLAARAQSAGRCHPTIDLLSESEPQAVKIESKKPVTTESKTNELDVIEPNVPSDNDYRISNYLNGLKASTELNVKSASALGMPYSTAIVRGPANEQFSKLIETRAFSIPSVKPEIVTFKSRSRVPLEAQMTPYKNQAFSTSDTSSAGTNLFVISQLSSKSDFRYDVNRLPGTATKLHVGDLSAAEFQHRTLPKQVSW